MKVVHLINGLGKGGAETMLYQVLRYRSSSAPDYLVISLGEGTYFEDRIRETGICVEKIAFRKSPIISFFKLCRLVKNANVINCWLYYSNLIGLAVSMLGGKRKLVWNIRHSNLSPKVNKKTTLFINKLCSYLSKKVDTIAYNGKLAQKVHEEMGYTGKRAVVLDNGCDVEEFYFEKNARQSIITELGLQQSAKIILSVSKDDPIKDWPTYIKAIAKCKERNSKIVALICGRGLTADNSHFAETCLVYGLEIGKDIFPLGIREDIPRLLSACDLYVLHSAGEAFPNALLQAMSCGCICISTDVGEARYMLDDDEMLVPVENSEQLSKKILEILNRPEQFFREEKKKNRCRVKKFFSIRDIVQKYESIFVDKD